jgi:hypothetical protein
MAMGLSEYIAEKVIGEMSGSTIMEDLLCRSNQRMPILGKLKRTEIIAVSCWYLWWQRREIVKGENVRILSVLFLPPKLQQQTTYRKIQEPL